LDRINLRASPVVVAVRGGSGSQLADRFRVAP
jgi:hypothetical protein